MLDAACGIGLLADRPRARGFRAEASDASPAMVAHTRATAARHHAELRARRVRVRGRFQPGPRFDAVFCVGNSIGHARDRRAALQALAATLKPGGALVLTSRNWERERALGSRTDGTHTWEIPPRWDAPHTVTVAVGAVSERLTYWPFTYAAAHARTSNAVDLPLVESTFTPKLSATWSPPGYPRT